MRSRRWIIGVVVVVSLVALPAWYLLSPLFINRAVDEAFPAAQAVAGAAETSSEATVVVETAEAVASTSTPNAVPTERIAETITPIVTPTERSTTTSTVVPATSTPTTVPSTPTPSAPIVLKSGTFHAVEHKGTGTATIYRLPDGKRVLRLENFATDNGPDLFVWLSSAPDANDAQAILNSQYVSLGRLKGNQGNQNYELPADLDLDNVHSVTIWCRQFSVNFTTAPLE